ncbi:MAG: sulfite exporter TauE/SafE family protein [Planctomycetota bacterium]
MSADQIGLLVAIGVIALTAGFIHSAIGFGFGIVAITLLPLVIDVQQSHVVISTASVPVLMMATWAYREGADWDSLWRALLAAAICLPLGLLAFEWLSADWLIRGTGLTILGMVWMNFRNRKVAASRAQPIQTKTNQTVSSEGLKPEVHAEQSPPTELGFAPWVAGGLAGFLAGAVSIAGPPVAAFALHQGFGQARFKAFVNQFLLVVSVYKVTGLAARGFLDWDRVGQAALLAPMAVLGIQLGALFSRRLSTNGFQTFVAVALAGVAIYFVVSGSGK